MKRVWSLLGVLAMVTGCAAGTEDPTGDNNLGTIEANTVGSDNGGADQQGQASDTQAGSTREKHSVFDQKSDIVLPHSGRGPSSPDPGPVHGPVPIGN